MAFFEEFEQGQKGQIYVKNKVVLKLEFWENQTSRIETIINTLPRVVSKGELSFLIFLLLLISHIFHCKTLAIFQKCKNIHKENVAGQQWPLKKAKRPTEYVLTQNTKPEENLLIFSQNASEKIYKILTKIQQSILIIFF